MELTHGEREVLYQGERETSGVGTLKWVKASDGDVPKHAVEGGTIAGETVYIGRVAKHDSSLIPGRIVKSQNCCFYSESESRYEYGSNSYEVLVCPYAESVLGWEDTTGDDIPPNAVEGGFGKPGEPYYIGRTRAGKKKDLIPGTVNPRAGVLTLCPNKSRRVTTYDSFEVLVLKGEVEIVEEISKQVFSDVKYDTSNEAVKHTTVPNVALANVAVKNESSLAQKMETCVSLLVTETFSWTDKSLEDIINSPMTDFKCGVPYISKFDVVHVTPLGCLPEQKLKLQTMQGGYFHYQQHQNVIPNVASVMIAGALPVNAQHLRNNVVALTTTNWGNPILRLISSDQPLNANVPPHTAMTVIVEGTKHILEVPYVANLSKVYKNGMTAEEEYRGTFQSTWFSDICIAYSKEETI